MRPKPVFHVPIARHRTITRISRTIQDHDTPSDDREVEMAKGPTSFHIIRGFKVSDRTGHEEIDNGL